MYEYKAQVIRIIDGDTIELDIDLGFYVHIEEKVRVLHKDFTGYDAPETSLRKGVSPEEKALGLEAKSFAEKLLPAGLGITVKTERDKTGKYGRFLAAITLPDGADFAELMTNAGYVK